MKRYYFVYILEMRDGRFYYGMTSSLGFRFRRHLAGEVKSTRKFRPLKIVYVEIFKSKNIARTREKELKTWKSHEKVAKLIRSFGSPASGV